LSFIRFIPAIAWFIVSLILLGLPGSSVPKYPWLSVIYADKWIHITLFFILIFLFAWPFNQSGLTGHQRKKWFMLLTISGIAFGTIMEFVQDRWIPNRSFEMGDIAADSIGCFTAYLYSIRKFIRKG